MNNLEESRLWKQLKKLDSPEAASIQATCTKWMPQIQAILTQSGTSPADFTLHDSQHAFRVAERMVEIMPDHVLGELSPYELALLLMSAYLHDIGMCPDQSRLNLYHRYLLTGDPQELDETQKENFQTWLDNKNENISIPLSQEAPSVAVLKKANLLLTHYCRSRHVMWGEEWIKGNLRDEAFGTYPNWIDDLTALCRSHHEGYSEIICERFRPKIVSGNSLVVHLRYLALVLRVADVMEFDPERTPEVIFHHREISPGSEIFWHKDHHVAHVIEGNRLTIAAEPPNAGIHNAIELMINDVEAELKLASRIVYVFRPFGTLWCRN